MPLDPVALCDGISRTAAALDKNRLAIAYSGGLDSTVLLDLVVAGTSLPLRALYVEHGLQGAQPEWRLAIEQNCRQRDVPLQVLDARPALASGASLEAAAREARYGLLAATLSRDELLLLAQHRDDQAETLLLQLLRGAGPAGLASMPTLATLGEGHMMRPLIDVAGESLLGYAQTRGLHWFDDPSNADTRFDRNYLRHEVMPALRKRWPGVATTLSRAAGWQAEADRLSSTLAATDARQLAPRPERFDGTGLAGLDAARQRNLLRFLCRAAALATPDARRLELVRELATGATPRGHVQWTGGEARRYRNTVHLLPPLPTPPDPLWRGVPDANGTVALPAPYGALVYPAPAPGGAQFQCRFRQGGERIRAHPDGHSVAFAAWCQREDIAPWLRSRLPLTFVDEALVAVGTRPVAPAFSDYVPLWRGRPRGLEA